MDRPDRQKRRRAGKSDPLDAIEAARAALSGRAKGKAKSRDGAVEAIRVLVVAKRSARQGDRPKVRTAITPLVWHVIAFESTLPGLYVKLGRWRETRRRLGRIFRPFPASTAHSEKPEGQPGTLWRLMGPYGHTAEAALFTHFHQGYES